MQPNLDVRRHADGSIDFDFYRRRASRRRRLSQRVLILLWVTYLNAMANELASLASRIARHLWTPHQRPVRLPASPQPVR